MNRAEMLQRLKAGEDPLEVSILKWQDIVDGKGEDEGLDNCALCRKFRTDYSGCPKCPIKLKTKRNYCDRTPYIAYSSHHRLEQAKHELEFLKGLRKAKKP